MEVEVIAKPAFAVLGIAGSGPADIRSRMDQALIVLPSNICVVRENHDPLLADLQICRFAALWLISIYAEQRAF